MCADCETDALLAFITLRMNLGCEPDDITAALHRVKEVRFLDEDEPEITHMVAGTA